MRRFDEAARIKLCLLSVGLATLLAGQQIVAQEILPSNQWTAESGTWETAGNWVIRGTDPAENVVPGEGNVAAIFNGGTATVGSSVPSIGELALRSGVLEMNLGGALTAGKAVIGGGGTLRWAGGTLSAEELVINGVIDLASAAASDLSFGSQWQVAQGLNVSGSPSSVTIDGVAPELDRGLLMKFGSTEAGAVVSVGNEPILNVDRATGNVQILNVAGGTLDIKGYSIASVGGLLSDDWNSLADQEVPGFAEANPVSGTRSTEYSLTGSTALTAGGALDLGAAYDAAQAAPPSEEDITFEYILADGSVFEGPVEYTGPLNDLLLKVDTASGTVSIAHESGFVPALEVTGFTISSESGSLNAEAFTEINETWTNTNPQASVLTQINLDGSEVFSTGSVVSLGSIFTGTQDLSFLYSLSDASVATGTVVYVEDVVESCFPLNELLGDLDGNGMVEFPDFLTLSANFNADVSGRPENQYTLGDIDCNGIVNFPDFLTLSMNFGSSIEGVAASVPEPGTGLLAMTGMLVMFMFRRRRAAASAVMAVAATAAIVAPQAASAQGLDARFIRIHPDGVNNGIGNVVEAMGIVDGSVNDVIFNEDISGSYEIIDLAGGIGSFGEDNPYLNGVNDASMDHFLTYLTGEVSFDEGTYTIACGSDDGCMINMPGISFTETFNENGPTIEGDGQILFNPGRGHDWTFGVFSVPGGGVTVPFESLSNEGGGGDSFEIAIIDFAPDPGAGDDLTTGAGRAAFVTSFMALFEDGAISGLSVSPGPFVPPFAEGDFNGDGVIDGGDAIILQDNMFAAGGPTDGDLTGDSFIDFDDLSVFAPIYEAATVAPAASVPEPASFGLGSLAIVALLGVRRRRNR